MIKNLKTYTATYWSHATKQEEVKVIKAVDLYTAQNIAFCLDAKSLAEHKDFNGQLSLVDVKLRG